MAEGDLDPDREQELTDALEGIAADDQSQSDRWGSSSRLRSRMDETRSVVESKRQSSRLVDAAFSARERGRRVSPTLLAGALASRLVIYVIPFLVLVVALTGFYSETANVDPKEAASAAGMAGLLVDAVNDSANATTGFRVATLVAMAVATLWAADSLGRLMRRIHTLVWAAPVTRIKRRWAVPLVVIAWSLGGLAISSLGMRAEDWPVTLVSGELVAEFAVFSLAWLLISRLLPHDPDTNRLRHFVPGALLVGVGIVGMKTAMVLYFAPKLLTLSARYGDVAWAIVVVSWAYWIAFIFVLAAELNAALFKSQRDRTLRA